MASKPRFFNSALFYHLYNCGTGKNRVFETWRDYEKFIEICDYYSYEPATSLSHFKQLSPEFQKEHTIRNPATTEKKRLFILAFCLMPNHFHILARPSRNHILSGVMSDISNSYTKYFNTKNDRIGSLFQGPFKSKEISNNGSVLNLSRYIHLNPVVSSRTNPGKNQSVFKIYPYSSYNSWAHDDCSPLVDDDLLREWVGIAGGKEKYEEFIIAQIESKKPLSLGLENLMLEKSAQ